MHCVNANGEDKDQSNLKNFFKNFKIQNFYSQNFEEAAQIPNLNENFES